MAVRRHFTAPILAAAVSFSMVACATSSAVTVTVPTDYLQLRFAPDPFTGKIPSFTIGVGTKVAVLAIPGNQDPPGYPTSQDKSIVHAVQWPEPNTAPRNWYPFVAVKPGRVTISESYPCNGTGCAAAIAQIYLTVVSTGHSTGQPEPSNVPSRTSPPPTPTVSSSRRALPAGPAAGYPTTTPR